MNYSTFFEVKKVIFNYNLERTYYRQSTLFDGPCRSRKFLHQYCVTQLHNYCTVVGFSADYKFSHGDTKLPRPDFDFALLTLSQFHHLQQQ